MTAPQHLHTKASPRTSGEEEKQEAEDSETVPQHRAPMSSVATGTAPTSGGTEPSDISWEDEESESEDSETTEQATPRRRGFDARAAMIFQNWRQTSGEAGLGRGRQGAANAGAFGDEVGVWQVISRSPG